MRVLWVHIGTFFGAKKDFFFEGSLFFGLCNLNEQASLAINPGLV